MTMIKRNTMLRLIMAWLLASAFIAAVAQTSSNTCGLLAAHEYPVNDNMCVPMTFDVSPSFTASMNPSSCSSGNNMDAWGWFTATQTSTVITYDPEGSQRPILHIFTGSCGALTQVACNNSGGNGLKAQVVINSVVGQIYYIRVQRHNSNSAMAGRICIYVPPANNDCGNAILLPAQDTCFMQTFTNEGATRSLQTPDPSCGGTINNSTMLDVWFLFYAPPNGRVRIETAAGSLTDAVMQLYSGPCAGLAPIQCSDDDGPGNMPLIDRRCDPLIPNATYRLRIFGKAGATGTFEICVKSFEDFYIPQEDCIGAHTICNQQSLVNNATDTGCTDDLNNANRGCLLSNERQGTWYYFSPTAAGTFEMTIQPMDDNGGPAMFDLDFAVWGPMENITCPPATAPVRCSYASPTDQGAKIGAGTYLTGMASGNTDTSEPAHNSGLVTEVNGFVAPLNVTASDVGKRYILYVDNFDKNHGYFKLDWTLGGGASLNCMVLPVELSDLRAAAAIDHVQLQWTTMSEMNTANFVVERSMDGTEFHAIGAMPAAGYSQQRIDYRWRDNDPVNGLAYYRLRQYDTDGSTTLSGIVTAAYRGRGASLVLYPNPAGESISMEITEAGDHTIDVFDGSGRWVRSVPWSAPEPGIHLMQLQGLEAGTYLVRVVSGQGHSAMGRFVKH